MSQDTSCPELMFENQICFPLYSAANAVVRAYRPLLDKLDLTYLQYMVMMLLWQHQSMSVKDLGEKLNLDSGTLTPLLKRLEGKELVVRGRSQQDERVRVITLTDEGKALKEQAKEVPQAMACRAGMSPQDAAQLKALCQSLLAQLA
ncbi:MarR family transcriptional regulator [Ferrimonas sp. YFM]|uniref:MarR family winged helix-turn-helix transcriptional regulator n=1 Tax=Ferrimonas sp. YFM TaxID=3028878 RepID=UPI002573849F|nr:MarR family transcriptional regulator [Ferrimonas sp. YFM]BDY04782.1 MarR family transcriptional regulator [Ferrimonas sp. YFM]